MISKTLFYLVQGTMLCLLDASWSSKYFVRHADQKLSEKAAIKLADVHLETECITSHGLLSGDVVPATVKSGHLRSCYKYNVSMNDEILDMTATSYREHFPCLNGGVLHGSKCICNDHVGGTWCHIDLRSRKNLYFIESSKFPGYRLTKWAYSVASVGSMRTTDVADQTMQLWDFIKVNDKYFAIMNMRFTHAKLRCTGAEDQAYGTSNSVNVLSDQVWDVQHVEKDLFSFKSILTGWYLTMSSDSDRRTGTGMQNVQDNDQLWKLIPK